MIFRSEYSILFLLVIIPAAVAAGIFFYRNENLEKWQKILLISLRSLSLALLAFLLLIPVIGYLKVRILKPVNAVLIDNSLSLSIDKRDSALRNTVLEKYSMLSGKFSNRLFLFADGIIKETDVSELENLSFDSIDNYRTDFAKSVSQLNEYISNENLSSVILVTDGIGNSGGSLLYSDIPVTDYHYHIIGDTTQKADYVLKDVSKNDYSYINTQTTIRAIINSFGIENTMKVNLYEEGNLKDYITIPVRKNNSSYEAIFKISSSTQGIVRYRITIESEKNEITDKNNSEDFFIKYYPNKFKILYINGSPSPDFAFISSQLKKIENFEIDYRTQKSGLDFYEGSLPEFETYNCVILQGFPTDKTGDNINNIVYENIKGNNIPVVFLNSSRTDYNRVKLFEDILPVSFTGNVSEYETTVRAVSNIKEEYSEKYRGIEILNSFPSVYVSKGLVFRPDAEIILTSSQGADPVLAIRQGESGRSAILNAFGIYKWRLNRSSYDYEEAVKILFTGIITELTDLEKIKKLKIKSSRSVYSKFQEIKFTGEVNGVKESDDCKVFVTLSKAGGDTTIELRKINPQIFEGDMKITENGDYKFQGELKSNDALLSNDDGRLIIGDNNFEYKTTRSTKDNLRPLITIGQGGDISGKTKKETEDILDISAEKSNIQTNGERTLFLRNSLFVLVIIIFLLSAEWFLRKRYNLP